MRHPAEITLEVEETVVFKQSDGHVLEFCLRCETEALFVTPEILAIMTGASEREIFRLVESGFLQFIEKRRIYACSGCYQRVLGSGDYPKTKGEQHEVGR